VTLIEADNSYILENGILTARVDKRSGKLESLKYNGLEMLDRQGGYWSHSAASPNVVASITIDPKSNSGERAEVSIKGVSKGRPMGSGPGGSVIADIEIRYALGRGQSGLYTYTILDHKPEYP